MQCRPGSLNVKSLAGDYWLDIPARLGQAVRCVDCGQSSYLWCQEARSFSILFVVLATGRLFGPGAVPHYANRPCEGPIDFDPPVR